MGDAYWRHCSVHEEVLELPTRLCNGAALFLHFHLPMDPTIKVLG